MSPLQLEVSNHYRRLKSPELPTRALLESIHRSGRFPIHNGELSIAFVDDATIARIHNDFMGDPNATDVITFPSDPPMDFAGEIIVSVDHALLRSNQLKIPFGQELSLYLIHGWLHLAGYDDRDANDRAKMKNAEQEALALLSSDEIMKSFRLLHSYQF